ncbi:hypothetical protein AOQ84DRAFT_355368, partial [Glonium stellatum]
MVTEVFGPGKSSLLNSLFNIIKLVAQRSSSGACAFVKAQYRQAHFLQRPHSQVTVKFFNVMPNASI